MSDDFCGLLDPSGFVPRAVCGNWTRWEIFLNNVSDLLIALAYVLIPIILVYFTRRRQDLPFSWVFLVFGAFIVTCGCTHVLEIVLFYYPVYHLAGWLKALTAVASWGAVFCLLKIAPAAFSLRSPSELEREIEHRRRAEAELADKNRRLEEAERLKDEFLANVSHELRTPLTLILSPAESLLSDPQTRPSQRPNLELIRGNSLRLLEQVNKLLDYSKYQSGKLEVNRQSTDMTDLCRQLVAVFQPLARQKGLNLTFQSTDQGLRWMDQYLYERILFNLLSNALKHARSQVTVELGSLQEQLVLTVTDDGQGIRASDRQRIFERFRQAQGQDLAGGTGLGLALVREFASVLGGSAEVSEGPGARFVVRLLAPLSQLPARPALTLSAHPVEPEFPDHSFVDGLPTILLAEDETELASYISALLKGVANVHLARDGSLAMALLETVRPDLILSDVMMPGLSGFEFCRQVKASPRWVATPLILITALTHREALLQGWEAGADEFLFKPFHPTELVTRVRTLLTLADARRSLENELLARNAELEQRVADRTVELSRALQLAEAANEAKTRFLGNLSHELRTPLTAVSGMAELAMAELPGPSIQDKLEKIRDSAGGLNGLLEDLVEYSRLESGRVELRVQPFDLRRMLVNLHASLSLQAQEKELEWTLKVAGPQEWWVEGDAGRLRQVLTNLLVNALKFTDRGGVTLEVDSTLNFSVSDSGTGIAPEDQTRILERFVQVDDSLAKNKQGLGLGLAICVDLLRLMGSKLRLDSQLGQGSRFSFQVQLNPCRKPVAPSASPVLARKILLVEDHPLNRTAVTLMLQRAGHTVEAAGTAGRALEMFQDGRYELAILDLQLPDMDGLELGSAILKMNPHFKLIALTAHAGEEWRERCMKVGFSAFLTKPVEQSDLVEAIRKLDLA